LKRRDSEQQVKQIIYDHFSDLSEEEVYMHEIGGKTLHDTLVADRGLWKKGELHMGLKYYSAQMQKFSDPQSTQNLLKPTNPSDQVDELLHVSLLAVIEKNLQQYEDWCSNVILVNNANFVAICRLALRMPAKKSAENLLFNLRTMEIISKLRLHIIYPEEWALMREHFDKVLQASLDQHKAEKMAVSFWWRQNRAVASLLLPEKACDEAMQWEGQWGEIAEQVEIIFHSSEVGRVLMEKGMRNMTLVKVGLMIETQVAEIVVVGEPITEALVAEARKLWVDEMRSKLLDPNKPFDKPKAVDVKYRRVTTLVTCTSPMDQFNVMMEAAIRTIAVDEGLLKPMWCEGDLVVQEPAADRVVEANLLKGSKFFREALAEQLSDEEASGENIAQLLKAKKNFFVSIDNKCRVELGFWSSCVGESARDRVQEIVLACLPDARNKYTINESLTQLQAAENSKLLVFSAASAQTLFKLCHGFVKSLKAGVAPGFGQGGASVFMQRVQQSMAFFLTYESGPQAAEGAAAGPAATAKASAQAAAKAAPVAAPAAAGATLYGAAAAAKRFAEVKAVVTADEQVSFENVSLLMCFGWLLKADELAEMKKLGQKVIATRMVATAAPKSKAKKSGQPATKDIVAGLFDR
jgi:hypothetical protein